MHVFLLLLTLLAPAAFAEGPRPPVVVETFTSQFCPNCPAGEAALNKYAEGRADFMVVLEHVDYWNDPASNRVDPLGSPDFTQRQYDYSNRLARRPGEVFTPQPILDGARMATPPLWMGWNAVLAEALNTNFKVNLDLKIADNGGLSVALPQGTPTAGMALTLLSVEKSAGKPNLWQARAMNNVPLKGQTTALGKAQVPAGGTHILVLLQESGAGVVKGSGLLAR